MSSQRLHTSRIAKRPAPPALTHAFKIFFRTLTLQLGRALTGVPARGDELDYALLMSWRSWNLSRRGSPRHDAVVVGSGPNGLAAAITLAAEGRSVLVLEGSEAAGGGVRSSELTLPGFMHDVCSAVHPMALSSPFFRTLPLAKHGLEFIHPPASVAHPFDDGTAALLFPSVDETVEGLEAKDRGPYRRLFEPLVAQWDLLSDELLRPLRPFKHPILLSRFGLRALRSLRGLANSRFAGVRARSLLGGIGAHSCLSLDRAGSASFALVLGSAAHAVGWPIVRGGSQRLAEALIAHFRSLGGSLTTGAPVASLDELPSSRVLLCDLTPRQLARVARDGLPVRYRARLERYRYGPGAFKLDWALEGAIPWRARECALAATVHLGGTLEEIAASERSVCKGEIPAKPYVILVQATLFDDSRAPRGRHTAWAYCHVPNGSTVDMSRRIEDQIERFAPGFRERVLARSVHSPADLERHNPNLVGGDVNGGAQDLAQLFLRPTARRAYTTPIEGLYICSASSPPGGGVHGMCGHHAARAALRRDLY